MIYPKDFTKAFLKMQMDGLTGHIEEAGYPFDCVEWGAEDHSPATTHEPWWRYEQVAYWLDGFTRCAILLEDQEALARATRIIYNVVDHPDCGVLGPVVIRDPKGVNYRWPHVVFFRACMALYDYNKDMRIPLSIRDHYLSDSADYSLKRHVMNVEIMAWAYEITGDERLLDMAIKAYDGYNEVCTDDACNRVILSDQKPYIHGVTYNEFAKLGAILYRYTGNESYLNASVVTMKRAEKEFMLPGGCICSNEHMNSNHYYQSSETCNISDMTWTLGYLMKITKNPHYADLYERCIFNAGMGAITEDFRALQYFSSANQVISDHQSNHNLYMKGGSWMQYSPNPGTECCPGNVNRFMPNYVKNLWGNETEGIYCYLYGASRFVTERYGGRIEIEETTSYPATDTVTLRVRTEVPFDLFWRVPAFMKEATLTVNGRSRKVKPGREYRSVRIEGDTELQIHFAVKVVRHERKGTVYFTAGALTYSLTMEGRRETEILGEGRRFPKYRMYADRDWQYAIEGADAVYTPCEDFREFRVGAPLPYLTVRARKIKNYGLLCPKRFYYQGDVKYGRKHYVDEPHLFTPRLPTRSHMELSDTSEELRLYPYGSGKLRVTVFSAIE